MRTILFTIIGSLIFLGVPLLAWGVRNVGDFFDNPARLSYTIVIVALQIFAALYTPPHTHKSNNNKEGIKQSKIDLILIQLLCLAIVVIAPYSDGHAFGILSGGEFLRYAGIVFTSIGFVLMQMAEKYLGKQFSVEVTIQKDHQLVTTGPFRYIRHPRYAGIVLFFLGVSLVFNSLWSIAALAALTVILIWRVFAEESLLKQEFGEQWEEYCAKTYLLIPYVF